MTDTSNPPRTSDHGWQDADLWPMGPVSRAALRGVVAALCPSPDNGAADVPPLAAVAGPVGDGVRLTLRYMEWPLALGLHVGLLLLDWSPLWRFVGIRPLHRLPAARAAAVVDDVGRSRFSLLRSLVMGARAAVLMQWYDLPEVHALMHYTPEPHFRERIALRERLLAGGEATDADMLRPLISDLPGGET